MNKKQKNVTYYKTTGQSFILSSILLENFLISVALKINQRLDEETLLRAINIEIERNEGLRCRMIKDHGEWIQYFISPFSVDHIQTYDCRNMTMAETEKKIDAVSEPKLKLKKSDPPFEFVHFIGPEGYDFLMINWLHAFNDGYAASLTLADTLRVYMALKGIREMPEPLSSVETYLTEYERQEERFNKKVVKDRKWFEGTIKEFGEPLYASAKKNGFNPSKCRALKPQLKLYKKVEMYRAHFDAELVRSMNDFCRNHEINSNTLFFTAFRIYYSAMNCQQKDISFAITLNSRGKQFDNYLPFYRTSMSLFRTIIDSDLPFSEALAQMDIEYMKMLRHYWFRYRDAMPYLSNLFLKGKSNYLYCDLLFSRFSIKQDLPEGWEAEGYWPCPKKIMDFLPIYAACIDSSDGGINLFYRYAVDRYDRDDIEKLHKGMVHILEKGMADPGLTLKALMADFE